MLNRYFKHLLESYGFENVEKIYYSLSYCQGDGCSFTCNLSTSDVLNLLPKVFPHSDTAATRVDNLMKRNCASQFVSENNYSVKVTQSDNHYVHENTMSAEHDTDSDEDPWDVAESAEQMTEVIIEYAKDCAKKLSEAGYSLLDSVNSEQTVVWAFRTNSYLMRLSEVGEDILESLFTEWDQDCFVSTCESLIAQKTRITALRASIYSLEDVEHDDDIDDERMLAEICLGGIECLTADKTYGGLKRELFSELLSDVRASAHQRLAA
jgi:hypothetical protein